MSLEEWVHCRRWDIMASGTKWPWSIWVCCVVLTSFFVFQVIPETHVAGTLALGGSWTHFVLKQTKYWALRSWGRAWRSEWNWNGQQKGAHKHWNVLLTGSMPGSYGLSGFKKAGQILWANATISPMTASVPAHNWQHCSFLQGRNCKTEWHRN